jgi:hypothetical protein
MVKGWHHPTKNNGIDRSLFAGRTKIPAAHAGQAGHSMVGPSIRFIHPFGIASALEPTNGGRPTGHQQEFT